MGNVVAIGKRPREEMRAAVEAMLRKVEADEVLDLAIMWQVRGRRKPQIVTLGRYKSEPERAAMALERFRKWVYRLLEDVDSA